MSYFAQLARAIVGPLIAFWAGILATRPDHVYTPIFLLGLACLLTRIWMREKSK